MYYIDFKNQVNVDLKVVETINNSYCIAS